ncbi:DUF5719 family protein [Actinomarinicola tropica]|uniref:Uncharacterized protein n=1 Tax=Actinomarinicola tropica TaxID=2789776 RepID=A0A5Q2RLL2_9ACTN|nr:DUF5719 family protein [Actinomarinicola tropica]QGG95812.1 hypothetical protein GH723_12275 [Actinomarinicola tropica]
MTRARIPVILFVLGSLVAAVLLDRSSAPDDPTPPEPRGILARTEPVVAPDEVLGSTWYCAAGSAGDIGEIPPPVAVDPVDGEPAEGETADGEAAEGEEGGETAEGGEAAEAAEGETIVVGPIVAEHTVVIANLADQDRVAQVSIHPGTDEPVELEVDLPAASVERVALADHVDAPAAAAMVEVPGGGVAVTHVIEGEHGTDSGTCAAASSDEWHFAWGDTSRDARSFVALFNPFPRDAVVDMSFVTVDGVREPRALTGLVVPGEGVVLADVGAEVRRRDHVSTTVRARAGRVVAERLQSFDDSDGRRGTTVDLGVTEPQEVWVHTYGRVGPDVDQRLTVYNPTDAPAEVDVEVALAEDLAGGVAPFELTVRPQGFVTIDLAGEDRILDAVGQDDAELTLTVRSLNGVPVVSDLRTELDGMAVSHGRSSAATTQVLVDPLGPDAEGRLRVLDLGGDDANEVEITVVRNGRRTELDTIELAPAGRAVVDLDPDDVGSGPAAILVTSSSPVLVELVNRFDEPSDLGVRAAIPFDRSVTPIPVLAG